jgi:hypothetical protein
MTPCGHERRVFQLVRIPRTLAAGVGSARGRGERADRRSPGQARGGRGGDHRGRGAAGPAAAEPVPGVPGRQRRVARGPDGRGPSARRRRGHRLVAGPDRHPWVVHAPLTGPEITRAGHPASRASPDHGPDGAEWRGCIERRPPQHSWSPWPSRPSPAVSPSSAHPPPDRLRLPRRLRPHVRRVTPARVPSRLPPGRPWNAAALPPPQARPHSQGCRRPPHRPGHGTGPRHRSRRAASLGIRPPVRNTGTSSTSSCERRVPRPRSGGRPRRTRACAASARGTAAGRRTAPRQGSAGRRTGVEPGGLEVRAGWSLRLTSEAETEA